MRNFLNFLWFIFTSVLYLIAAVFLGLVGVILFSFDAVEIKVTNLVMQEEKPAWENVSAIYTLYHAELIECWSGIKNQSILYYELDWAKRKKL